MWFYRSPDIIYGPDSLQFLESLEIRRAVIVTDTNVRKAGLVDLVTANLNDTEIRVIDGIPEEPSIEEIAGKLESVVSFNPEWIIAVGGGSTIDAAKLLFFKSARPDLDYFDLTPLVSLGLKKKLGLIAIPTTSGTGSECTWAAVITDSNDKRKAELASPEVIPNYSILDPAMVLNLPPEITGNTATDALTHAIEAFVSTWKNPYSDALSVKAVSMLTKSIQDVVKDPKDPEARGNVHIGASMAGSAFSNAQIGLAHAVGHAFGSIFKRAHGICVGIFLPGVIRFNSSVSGERYDELNNAFDRNIRGKTLDESVSNFMKLLGRPLNITQLEISENSYRENFERIIELTFESTGIIGNPKDVKEQDIREILNGIV